MPFTNAAPAAVERARVADRGRRAVRLPAVERGAHVVGAPRGDAEARDVDEERLDGRAERRGRGQRPGLVDGGGEAFGDGRRGGVGHGAAGLSWRLTSRRSDSATTTAAATSSPSEIGSCTKIP